MKFNNMGKKTEEVKMGRYTASLVMVTPSLAEEMLRRNINNRTIKKGAVNAYAEDMMHKRWNGLSIIAFNEETGELMDGQHRLMAIVKSGTSQIMVVAEVKSEDVFDIGAVRSVRDIMVLSGGENLTNTLIGAVGMSIRRSSAGGSRVSKPKIIERYMEDKERWDSAGRIAGRGLTKKSAFVTAIYYALKCGVEENVLEEFTEVVATGFYENECDASGVLCRNMLMETTGRNRIGWDVEGKIEEYIRLFAEGTIRKKQLRIPTWCYSKRIENDKW